MRNARILGGLLAHTSERRVFPDETGAAAMDVRLAAGDLRQLAELHDVTNAAFLADRRREYSWEQQRAEALHVSKFAPLPDVRQMYLREEPALMAAIRCDDRAGARGILNRLLTAICYLGGQRLDLVKSFFMELVVMMCRTAVEVGGNSRELLGVSFACLEKLSQIDSEETLSAWLRDTLEKVMDAIRSGGLADSAKAVSAAMQYLSKHFAEVISRDDAAEAAGLSPAYFSRIFKSQMRKSFTAVLNELRVGRACELLVRTRRPLVDVAIDSGFGDQSYFTRVFRRQTGLTPKNYRRRYEDGE
jgi:AraC-like DNA-binding protein